MQKVRGTNYKGHQRALRKVKKYEQIEAHTTRKPDMRQLTEYEKYRLAVEELKRRKENEE